MYVYPLYSLVFYYSYNILGVPKSPEGYIIGKVHLTPLNQFIHLVPLLNEEDKQEFCRVMVGTMFVPYKTVLQIFTMENAVNLHSMATVPSYL